MSVDWVGIGTRLVDFFAAEFPVVTEDSVREDLTWILPL